MPQLKVSCRLVSLFAVLFVAISLTGCGSSETQNSGSGSITGTAHATAPLSGAAITVKDVNGLIVGRGVADANGVYTVPLSGTAPYFAEAVDQSGTGYYGASTDEKMNITHLSTALLNVWYGAHSSTAVQGFNSLSAESTKPNVLELKSFSRSLMVSVSAHSGLDIVDIFRQSAATYRHILAGSTVSPDGKQINITLPGGYTEVINLSPVADTINHQVDITGQSTVTPAPGSTSGLTVRTTHPLGASIARLGARTGNSHWMADMEGYLKDRKLSEIVIPGTHDSGTAGIPYSGLSYTAVAQNRNISEQLNDGIRYFDFRLEEIVHKGCADDTVWQIHHGTAGSFLDSSTSSWGDDFSPDFMSYKFVDILQEIKAFTEQNPKEILILDLQEVWLRYSDARASALLMQMIQRDLGPYLFDSESWRTETLGFIWSTGEPGKNKRILVVVPTWITQSGTGGCGNISWDKKYFFNRDTFVHSFYKGSDLDAPHKLRANTADPQLNRAFAQSAGLANLFYDYRNAQNQGHLNVLQIVSLPEGTWYAGAAPAVPGAAILPANLLEYGSYMNAGMNNADVGNSRPTAAGRCVEGWLGKRFWMGSKIRDADWNRPNIIIVDNYANDPRYADFNWVAVNRSSTGRWSQRFAGGFVDFIKEINKTATETGFVGSSTAEFNDGQCLSN